MLKQTTFRAHTRYQVTRNQSSRAMRRQDLTDRRESKMRRDVACIRNRKKSRTESWKEMIIYILLRPDTSITQNNEE